jgi:hypothetical protein
MNWWNYFRYGLSSIIFSNIFLSQDNSEETEGHKDFIDDQKLTFFEKNQLYYEEKPITNHEKPQYYSRGIIYGANETSYDYDFLPQLKNHLFFLLIIIMVILGFVGFIYWI